MKKDQLGGQNKISSEKVVLWMTRDYAILVILDSFSNA